MNTRTVLAMLGLISAPVAAHAHYGSSAILFFKGVGTLCSWAAGGEYNCVDDQTFKGTIKLNVRADGPSGADAYTDGSTIAGDEDGSWVRSDFMIEWDNESFNPAPGPRPFESRRHVRVLNDSCYDYPHCADSLTVGEQYVSRVGDTEYFSAATLDRSTIDGTSWLTPAGDLSFDLAALGSPLSETPWATVFFQNTVENAAEGEYRGDWGLISLTSLAIRINVEIDIRPASPRNTINVRSSGVIPVAILGSGEFDATQVDSSTVEFGPAGAAPVHDARVADVDRDAYPDVLLHFRTQATRIKCGTKSMSLIGRTFSGAKFAGSDSIRIVGCKK